MWVFASSVKYWPKINSLASPRCHKRTPFYAVIAGSDSIDSMATLTIRQIDDATKTRLRVRAAHHGRSMEQEARDILRTALSASRPAKGNLAASIQRRFAEVGGVDLELPRRDALRRAAKFDR